MKRFFVGTASEVTSASSSDLLVILLHFYESLFQIRDKHRKFYNLALLRVFSPL